MTTSYALAFEAIVGGRWSRDERLLARGSRDGILKGNN